jgi:lipoprotein-releasing system permease protein
LNFKLIIDIAINLIRARLKQSVIAAVGVTFGIAMFITLLGFMNGLNNLLDGLMLNRTPHVRLYNEVKPSPDQPVLISKEYKGNTNFIQSIKPKDRGREIFNSKAIIHILKQDKRVIDVAPKVTAPVFFNAGSIEIAGVVNGIDVPAEEHLFKVSDYVIEGNVFDLNNENNTIIIGKGLAEKMLVKIGDVIKITTIKGGLVSLKVVGIMQIGIAEIDNTMSYTSLRTAQMLLGEAASYITDIQVKLTDVLMAPAVAKEYQEKFKIDVIDAQTANSQFETGSKVSFYYFIRCWYYFINCGRLWYLQYFKHDDLRKNGFYCYFKSDRFFR